MNLPVEVIEAARSGRCVIFLGSAAAREAAQLAGQEYPDGKELAKLLGWQRPKVMVGARPKPVVPSVSAGAEKLQAQQGRDALVRRVRELVGCAGVAPSFAHTYAVQNFRLVITTCWDELLEQAAGPEVLRQGWGDPLPEPGASQHVIWRWRGRLSAPDTLVLTDSDRARRDYSPEFKNQIRMMLRRNVVFFVGYRPDEEEFDQLWEDLTVCYGGELPRCHLAAASGEIDDYQWQRWVWRGLLLFAADPVECLQELQARSQATP